MEKDKKIDAVKDVIITLKGIELETNPQDGNEVKRVRFQTDKGDITWKPKIEKKVFLGAMKVLKTVFAKLDDLPNKLETLNQILQEKGSCKLKVSYQVMTTEEGKVYNFIRTGTFDKWELVSDDPVEEAVF